jgi:hypothetical protein
MLLLLLAGDVSQDEEWTEATPNDETWVERSEESESWTEVT